MGYWHDANGWDFVWMTLMMLLWIVLVMGAVWATVTLIRGDRAGDRQPSARDELDRRLARGEITDEEYERIWARIVAPDGR